jgi:uncharacterized protein (TIGR02246 family)
MTPIELQIRAALHAWECAFNAADADAAAALYAPDAFLWGTMAQSLIATPEGVREYFARTFAAGGAPRVAFGDLQVCQQEGAALSAGLYTFTFTLGAQSRELPARFSFAWHRVDGRWLVTSHHSSLMPPAMPGA